MPVNAKQKYKSFIDVVLPLVLVLEKNMGIIDMKVYVRGFASRSSMTYPSSPGTHVLQTLGSEVTGKVIGAFAF